MSCILLEVTCYDYIKNLSKIKLKLSYILGCITLCAD
jgi:hypothetical protein